MFTPYLPGVQVSAQKLWNPTWTNPVDQHQCLAVFPAEAVTYSPTGPATLLSTEAGRVDCQCSRVQPLRVYLASLVLWR